MILKYALLYEDHDPPRRRSSHSVEQIRQYVEADTLDYLSMEGLRRAVADHDNRYCYACYTARYPTDLVGIETMLQSGERRN